MSRISFNTYSDEEPVKRNVNFLAGLVTLLSNSANLIDAVKLVTPGHVVYWASNGEYSMHELMLELLNRFGAAHVYISSYGFGETACRTLAQLQTDGLVKSLNVIVDNRVQSRTAISYSMLKVICDKLKLASTHAKILVLYTDSEAITVVCSSNFTINKRWEAGTICMDRAVADMYCQIIKDELNKRTN